MGVYSRRVLYVATGVAIIAMVTLAIQDAEIKIYLSAWLAALVTSLTTAATLFMRPNEGVLAQARLQLAALQVDGAMRDRDATPPHWFRHSA